MNNDTGEKGKRTIHPESEEESHSPILSTRYAHKAAQMFRSLQKNFLVIIGVIVAVFVFALIDIVQIKGYLSILPDEINDTIIIFFAIISLASLLFVIRFLIKSKRLLNNWANVFERNSIRAGISIAIANKTKEGQCKLLKN